jgi:hypothetical protein
VGRPYRVASRPDPLPLRALRQEGIWLQVSTASPSAARREHRTQQKSERKARESQQHTGDHDGLRGSATYVVVLGYPSIDPSMTSDTSPPEPRAAQAVASDSQHPYLEPSAPLHISARSPSACLTRGLNRKRNGCEWRAQPLTVNFPSFAPGRPIYKRLGNKVTQSLARHPERRFSVGCSEYVQLRPSRTH